MHDALEGFAATVAAGLCGRGDGRVVLESLVAVEKQGLGLALAGADEPEPPLNTDPREGAAGYRFLAQSSRGNLKTDFTSADKGKTACYALRWVSTRGEKGPWSEVAAATVAA